MPQHEDDIIPHQDEVEQVVQQEIDAAKLSPLFDITPHFTPAAGWSMEGWAGSYILPNGELVMMADIKHAGALAVAVGDELVLGTLDPALNVLDFDCTYVAGNYPGWQIVHGLLQIFSPGGVPTLRFRVMTAHASAANLDIEAYGNRWALANPKAARALVA